MRPPARFGASSSRIHMHPTAQAQLQSQASNGPVSPHPRACADSACAPRTERARDGHADEADGPRAEDDDGLVRLELAERVERVGADRERLDLGQNVSRSDSRDDA